MFMLQWDTRHPRAQAAINRMSKSEKYTATQLKALSDWQLRFSSAGYIGIILGLISMAKAGLPLSMGIVTLVFLVALISIFFFFQGLCDCEAANIKAALEATKSEPKAALKYRPAQCRSYPRTSRSRLCLRKIRH